MNDNVRNHLNFLSKPWNIQEKVNRFYIWHIHLCWVGKTICVKLMFYQCSTDVILMYLIHVNLPNNGMLYFGLIDAKIRASDKDLPVITQIAMEWLFLLMNWQNMKISMIFSWKSLGAVLALKWLDSFMHILYVANQIAILWKTFGADSTGVRFLLFMHS